MRLLCGLNQAPALRLVQIMLGARASASAALELLFTGSEKFNLHEVLAP